MIAVIDYGVGNLFSLKSSLSAIGTDVVVTSDPEVIKQSDKLLLPGVGAFEDAAKKLRDTGLDKLIVSEAKNGKPILGICLGMQLLFEKSYEYGEHQGLGLIKGSILPLADAISKDLKVPHMGWNALNIKQADCPLFKYIKDGDFVYFVHSYYAPEDAHTAASAEYGVNVTAAVADGNVFGCQFHPEKSGEIGLQILRAFCEESVEEKK